MLMGLMLISAFAEVVSLGAVLPFIGILTAPERVFNHPVVSDVAKTFGITEASEFVFPITVAFAAVALTAAAIRILLLWATTKLMVASGSDLSNEVYRRTLYQPYRVHVSRNSSDTISAITSKVDITVFGVLLPLLTLISSVVLLIAVMLALIFIDPVIALAATIGFGASYGAITWLTRHRLEQNSRKIARGQTQAIKALQEGLGGIRDVLLDGTQHIYSEIYNQASHQWRSAHGNNIFVGGSPRFAMEALGMVLIAVLAYILSLQSEGIVGALPVLGALALGAQRLLPALQQIYSAWASIAGSRASLVGTIALLDQPMPAQVHLHTSPPLHFVKDVRFSNVRFRYTGDGPWVIDNLNLVIPKGVRAGFVGGTGSGKTTTLDLLMGLLVPTEGEVLVDGQPIRGDRIRAWQQSIAHVPQNIFLADTSIAENIAFGVPKDAIDMDRVCLAARQAQIAGFIEQLSDGYNTMVGERGIRLSGGQRQRIGIARALYKQASVLVFDEATSALDSLTEKSVMEAIDGLNRDLTILLIAHRLTTVRRCDMIVELEHGRVVAQGTYDQLLVNSPSFLKVAKATD
jgi:ATP-binding cassette subfamily B protein